jgi:hypothetical protein
LRLLLSYGDTEVRLQGLLLQSGEERLENGESDD